MHTIDDSLAHLLRNGFILLDDALARCRDKSMMHQANQETIRSGKR